MFIFSSKQNRAFKQNHFRWNQSFENHTAWSSICIFQGIELFFKLYLRLLYLLYQTSKVVWFYLYKNKDQKWLIQIFSSKWMILLLMFNFHSMHFSALQRTKEHFERHQEVTFNSFIPVLTSPVFNIRTPSPSSNLASKHDSNASLSEGLKKTPTVEKKFRNWLIKNLCVNYGSGYP